MGMREEAMRELARRELARREQAKSSTPEVIEEMHPEVSWQDRAIVKNFSQSPEKSANYLKKHNPQLDTRVWDGRVLVKGKNETQWRPLDPDAEGFDGLGEFARDIGDVGYDVLSGVGQALALPAGGIVGSGIAGAGAEALRQGIGSAIGIDNELGQAAQDVALTGAIGAAVPAIGKAITPTVQKAAEKGLEYAPAVLSKIGGQSKQQVQTLADNLGDLKVMDKKGISGFVDNTRQQALEAVESATRKAGEDIGSIVDSVESVDISPVKQQIKARIEDLKKQFERTRNPATADDLGAAIDNFNSHFGKLDDAGGLSNVDEFGMSLDEIPDIVSGRAAFDLKQNLKGVSKSFNESDAAFKSRFPKSSSTNTKMTAKSFGDAEMAINDVMEEASGGQIKQANKIYAQQQALQDELAPALKSKEKLANALRTLGTDSNRTKAELLDYLDKNYGTNLIQASNKLNMANTFGEGAKNIGGLDVTEITKQTPFSTLLGTIGGVAGWGAGSGFAAAGGVALGQAVGKKMSSPAAIRKYVETLVRTDKYAKVMDKKTKEWLKKELYKKINKGDALREAIKASQKISEER